MRFPARIEIRPSRRLRAALCFVHLLAATALAISGLPIVATAVAVMVVACSLWRCRALPPVIAYRLGDDGILSRYAADGEPVAIDLLPGAVVLAWLVVARVRDDNGRDTLLAFPDSLPAADLRRLRLWLRWRAKFSGGASA